MNSIRSCEILPTGNRVIGYRYEETEWIKDFFSKVHLKTKKGVSYYNVAAAFDIETTQIPYKKIEHENGDVEFRIDDKYRSKELVDYENIPTSFMWHWQFAFYAGGDEIYVYGRRWEQFLFFVNTLESLLHLGAKRILPIYAHNLAFEFQYIQCFFDWESVFARRPRKVMKCRSTNGFEFRCSYFLSNMSLGKFCENTKNVFHQKMIGELDYNVYRDWSTLLTEKEFWYCINDVLGLVEAIWQTMLDDGDNIITIPLTSTGYVRRDVRNHCFEDNHFAYKKLIDKGFPDEHLYKLMRDAFRGGDTHAYYAKSNKTYTNVYSYDIKSSYPAWMLLEEYPTGKAIEHNIIDMDRFIELMETELMVMEIDLFDVEMNFDIAMPYIDLAHVSASRRAEKDNGRVLSAEYIHYTCTSIDLQIILEEYSFSEIAIRNCWGWKKQKLPVQIREMVMSYFQKKTKLDGIEEKHYEYVKSKNKLNSIFGMMVTPYDQWEILYSNEEIMWEVLHPDLHEQLKKVQKSYNTFLLYQWGLFITAYARLHLHMMLQKVGRDAIYIDTDSIKFIGEHNKRFFEQENERLLPLMEDMGAYAYTIDGVKEVLGLWEGEGCYEEFKTVGAKKYCYKKNGEYVITVSGMNKEKGSKKIHSMDDFELGKKYDDIGRKTVWYNDCKPFLTKICGNEIIITPNIGMIETSYLLGVTDEYLELLLSVLNGDKSG